MSSAKGCAGLDILIALAISTIEVPAGARIWPMNAVVPATTIWPPPTPRGRGCLRGSRCRGASLAQVRVGNGLMLINRGQSRRQARAA
jgi:hypothetical protein